MSELFQVYYSGIPVGFIIGFSCYFIGYAVGSFLSFTRIGAD